MQYYEMFFSLYQYNNYYYHYYYLTKESNNNNNNNINIDKNINKNDDTIY